MSDDLKRRLLDVAEFEGLTLAEEAADRIEELEAMLAKAMDCLAANGQAAEAYQAQLAAEAKLAEEIEISNQRGNHIEFVLLPQMSDLQFQLKDLQAKLAKAVEVAEKSIKWLRLYGADVHREATTIADLKGEK